MSKIYSYTTAKDVLSETDKNRIVAIYLAMTNPNSVETDWGRACQEFGCASQNSMKVMLATALKKIEKAGGCTEANGTPVTATKTSSKPKGKGRQAKGGQKRKGSGSDDEDETDIPVTPKKPRGTSKKDNAKYVKVEEDAGHEEDMDAGDDMFDNIVVKTDDSP